MKLEEVGGLVKRLRAAEASDRIYGFDHTADLIAEADNLSGELATERAAHAETKRERDEALKALEETDRILRDIERHETTRVVDAQDRISAARRALTGGQEE